MFAGYWYSIDSIGSWSAVDIAMFVTQMIRGALTILIESRTNLP